MSVNVELLDRTLAHIEAHPSEWNQETYRCGTAMCFAGWACELAGGQWADVPYGDDEGWLIADENDHEDDVVDGLVHCSNRADRVLGIDDLNWQEHHLFYANNTLDDLRRIVADIKAGA